MCVYFVLNLYHDRSGSTTYDHKLFIKPGPRTFLDICSFYHENTLN